MATADDHFLIIDDDALVRRSLARMVREHGVIHAAATAQEACALIAAQAVWRAFFLDVVLPDGSGLEVLATARRSHPCVPAMVLTGYVDDRVVNAAFDLRPAWVVGKPYESHRVRAFLLSLPPSSKESDSAVGTFAAHHQLSASEADILRRLIVGESAEEIALARGTSILTVRKQIALLRSRTGDDSIRSLVIRALSPPFASLSHR